MPLRPDWTDRLRSRAVPVEEPGGVRRAGVAVAVCDASAQGPRVLLMRRSVHPHDPWSGQVSLPGGRVEPSDGTSLAAARRETLEELGVDLERSGELLGPLDPVRATAKGRTIDLLVHPWVWRLSEEVVPVPNEEAEEGFWLPLALAVRGELDHTHRIERNGETHLRPSWRVGRHVVWGLTRQILDAFVRELRREARGG
ncbi:MAG: CoA pyrophosphatase [Planctomycetota bacterium]